MAELTLATLTALDRDMQTPGGPGEDTGANEHRFSLFCTPL